MPFVRSKNITVVDATMPSRCSVCIVQHEMILQPDISLRAKHAKDMVEKVRKGGEDREGGEGGEFGEETKENGAANFCDPEGYYLQ